MQDTNKQQDELLNSIFNNQACKLQKFGDQIKQYMTL